MRKNPKARARSWALIWGVLLLWPAGTFAQGSAGTASVEFTHARYAARPNASMASITLRRTGATNTAVTIEFSTEDDSAEAGIDYAAKTGPITFAPGQDGQTIDIPVLNRTRRPGNAAVRLELRNPSPGAVLGPRSTAELVLPRIWKSAWLNFGLDRVEALKETWFDIPIWQYLASLIYIFLAFAISKAFDLLIRGRLREWARKTPTQLDDMLLELVRGPIKVVLFVILLHVGLRVFVWPDWIADFISKGLRIVVAISLTYMALKFIDLMTAYWRQRVTSHADKTLNDQLLPIIRNTLKLFTVIVAAMLTLQNLGLNVTSLIASLSIGGLALSLAAQDTLSNLFGAVAVLTDKPFLIGDRIKLDQIEGVVESVGLRSTRLRTLDGHVVSIPNKTVGNAIITKLASQTPTPPP